MPPTPRRSSLLSRPWRVLDVTGRAPATKATHHDRSTSPLPLLRKVKRMPRTLTVILGTLVVAALIAIGGAYAFIMSGIYDVSATTPDASLVRWVTHETSDRSVARRMGDNVVPPGLDAAEKIAAGGALDLADCAGCHGGPGLAPTAILRGLDPQPPNFSVHMQTPSGRKLPVHQTWREDDRHARFCPDEDGRRDLVAGRLPECGARHEGRKFHQVNSERNLLAHVDTCAPAMKGSAAMGKPTNTFIK